MLRSELVLATTSAGKLREIRAALADLNIVLVGLDPSLPEVAETGATFLENAAIKARAARRAMGRPALADDSGLVVDALGGRPGIYSARWADGEQAGNARLIRELAGVPAGQRSARYICAMVTCLRDGREAAVQATCEGSIGWEPRGTGGFGYDPYFILPDGRTVAELSLDEKNLVSHRAKALAEVRVALASLLAEGAL